MKKRTICTCLMATACLSGCGTAIDSSSAFSSEITTSETESISDESSTVSTAISVDSESTETVGKTLVVYFSATGTTKSMAEELAAETGADLYEIVPTEPYSDADLNYNDSNCRANREQNDSASRPEIASSIENLETYDMVFIGHPIWRGIEPRIIDTFMESYDFSDKKIAHFCTSGGSGISASDENLKAYCTNAEWLGSMRLSDSGEISVWLTELGILA